MKRIFQSTVLALLIVSFTAPAAFATCTQGGQCAPFGCTLVQYLYNIDFSENCSPAPQVWKKNALGAATFVQSGGSAMCGGYFQSYVQMNANGGSASTVTQRVTIPSTETRTHWTAGWNISMTDPHHDSYDQLYVRFYDVTAMTTLGTSTTYYGNGTDPNCRMDTISLGTHNLAGHTIEVTINALIDGFYPDTHFFLTNVQLDATF